MTDDEFKVLSDRVDNIQKTLDRLAKDFDDDRKYLHDFIMRLGQVQTGQDEVRRELKSHGERIKDSLDDVKEAVEAGVEPVVKEAKGLRNIIRDKKFIAFKDNRGFFSFLKFWERNKQ